jgi:hypothetical protein
MYKLWNGVVHKKAAYVWKLLALGLDVLVYVLQLPPFSAKCECAAQHFPHFILICVKW